MSEKLERLPRCCEQHSDWQVLTEHLGRDFPTVSGEQVLRNVLDAQTVTQRFKLDESEAIEIAELIVRYRLLLSTGQLADVARTDPQTHHVNGAAAALNTPPSRADVSLDA
ncbi:MAG TPA: hypothetical protein VG650_17005 [Mycobacteriales bacterium]|nr:hypothetical protein [Mycobacteriales bacterium]